MRFALIVAAAGVAGLFVTVAQPTSPSTPTAPRAGQERKLMPVHWKELQEALRDKRLQRATLSQMTIEAGAPQPSMPVLLPFDPQIAADAIVIVFPQPHAYAATLRIDNLTIDVHGDRRAMVLKEGDPLLRAVQS